MLKKIFIMMTVAVMLIVCACPAFAHIYDDAEIIEHPVDGNISVCTATEKECTLEALNDWYYNYILTTDYAWYMILFSDANGDRGVYGTKDGVEMTVTFARNSKGWYVGSEKYAVWYLPSGEDGLILAMGC